MLANLPPFVLTADQRTKLDAERSDAGKTVLLQVYHQTHAFKHRQIVGAFGSLDPARFSKEWAVREYEFMAEAWAAYRGSERKAA